MNDKTKILYVDDESMNLLLFKRLFKDHYQIFTANSGNAGIEVLLSETGIRAVICDMKMPGMDGIEFATTAKKMFPETQFFILTGFDFLPEISKAMNSNTIVKYFSKPLNINDITTSIDAALK